MRLDVIAEGEGWAALAKPPRLAIHRSELVSDRQTVVSVAGRQFRRPIHTVHRLDRAASGCLLIAFDGPTSRLLQEALQSPETRKTYVAFVRGFFRWDDPVPVDKPMADDNGIIKEASSVVELLGRSHDPRCSLLRVFPRTGRYHQVRRHVRDLGHPILMDHTHGDTKVNAAWREAWGLDRLGLHALRVELALPDGVRTIECPPATDLAALWRKMPWWEEAVVREPALALEGGPPGQVTLQTPPSRSPKTR